MGIKDSDTHYSRFEPWFGSWPPEFKGQQGEDVDMSKRNDWREKWTTPFLLFSTISGIGFILASAFNEGVLFAVMRDIGIALLIAGGLGLTVDKLLRQQLAMDAFNASMGYLLPTQLKPELEWIYKQDIIAEVHRETLEIIPLSDDLVSVQITYNRTLRNISHHKVPYTPLLWLEEWFHQENTQSCQ